MTRVTYRLIQSSFVDLDEQIALVCDPGDGLDGLGGAVLEEEGPEAFLPVRFGTRVI